jgi:hypothetical protein
MSWRCPLTAILSITCSGLIGVIGVDGLEQASELGEVIAGSRTDGVVVPGTGGKVRVFPNHVYSIEPTGFGVSQNLRDIPPDDSETIQTEQPATEEEGSE